MRIGWKRSSAGIGVVLAAVVALLVATNPAPQVPAFGSDARVDRQPYVVKLHARWCPVCMVTKDVWTDVQLAYGGRVRFVVFDFTTDGTTEAARQAAGRLGLQTLFDEYAGETGTVLVLDGVTKEVRHALHGERDFAIYRTAIDGVLAGRVD
jgi:hypothetical protein